MNPNHRNLIGMMLMVAATTAHADSTYSAEDYLSRCLPLAVVQQITGLPLTSASEGGSPQGSCGYSDNRVLREQSRVLYGRDSGYKTPFGESDIMQSVAGLGQFAEYDLDGGQLYVNVGRDGLVFEGRQGKNKLSLDLLKALAVRVLESR